MGVTEVLDIPQKAERIIKSITGRGPDTLGNFEFSLTTSQIRKFLTAVVALQNRLQQVEGDTLDASFINEIKYLKIKLAYQAGRKTEVKEFAVKSDMFEEIDKAALSKGAFMQFAQLIEGIVAYHRFYGGRES